MASCLEIPAVDHYACRDVRILPARAWRLFFGNFGIRLVSCKMHASRSGKCLLNLLRMPAEVTVL
jgi:hypothetical protein